jgi:hypothetical protein
MKTGYCADYEYKNHPAGLTFQRSHFSNLALLRKHLKDAVSDGSIKKESIRVYHGWDASKVDVTTWALQPIKF